MNLDALDTLLIDCQAAGATPAHGDLLELGWGVAGEGGLRDGAHALWILPQTDRPISSAVRRLTGYDEAAAVGAVAADEAWRRLLAAAPAAPSPTLIHWARFELPFLRALHGDEALPLDVICLHAIAERLFPDLPRRNLRALAGHLGFSPSLVRRAAGHVEASAFIWRAIVPELAARGVTTWDTLRAFASGPKPPRATKRVFTFDQSRRRTLPTGPGVYRFHRRSGDVVYVGKAVSVRKRVASHFSSAAREVALEMLTQVSDVTFVETKTALQAALLECDEIKRLDPPYNQQLKASDRRVWFADSSFANVRERPDATFHVGPLPSERSLVGLAAIRRLALGGAVTPELAADACSVPRAFAPDVGAFERVFATFDPGPDVLGAAHAAWLAEAREDEDEDEDDGGHSWTEPRILRALERSLVQGGLLVRRARWLCLLSAAHIRVREARDVDVVVLDMGSGARARLARQAEFDAARYDRIRVLSTELRRVLLEGGDVSVTVRGHRIDVSRVYAAL